jgi:endonuclease/exonuclease/phosphatase (EEP) superfamily protein YafD
VDLRLLLISPKLLLWLVVGFFSLFTLLGFLSRIDWRLELFSHFRIQYSLILGICALSFLIFRQMAGFITSLVFMSINLALLLPFYRHSTLPSSLGPVYRIFFANILGSNIQYPRIMRAIEKANADIILLVEVRPNHLEALQTGLLKYPNRFTLPRVDNFGLAIFSRLPLQHVETLDFNGVILPTLVTRLSITETPLTLVSTHPFAPKNRRRAEQRNVQLATIARFVSSQPGELLLLGDFNTTPWSHIFQELMQTSRLLNSLHGFGLQPSWPAANPWMAIPIDHALHTPGITIRSRQLGAPTGSDHRPIIVDFSLSNHSGDLLTGQITDKIRL